MPDPRNPVTWQTRAELIREYTALADQAAWEGDIKRAINLDRLAEKHAALDPDDRVPPF